MFGLSARKIAILLVLVVIAFAASQYVPPYVSAFQFNDYVREQVKYAASSRKNAEALRSDVYERATELGIPLKKSDIHITRRGLSFTLDVEYSWPIDMKLYQHRLTFRTSETGEAFEDASD